MKRKVFFIFLKKKKEKKKKRKIADMSLRTPLKQLKGSISVSNCFKFHFHFASDDFCF